MRSLAFAALVLGIPLTAADPALAQEKPVSKSYPTFGKIIRLDKRLDALLPADAKLEKLADGFEWAEGPIWVPADGGYLLFSDIPRNAIFKWTEAGGVSLYMKPSGYTGVLPPGPEPGSNGLTLDAEGRLVLCEHGDRRVARVERDGGKRTLADQFEGKRLNSPNDLVYHPGGDLYFTDPPYGLRQREKDPHRELDFYGVYRLGTDGRLTLLTKEMTRPNGLAFSPDYKTLYVAQSDPQAALWRAFEVRADGTLGASRLFGDMTSQFGKLPGLPDGLKVDAAGNLWATGPGGVHIFAPDGTRLGTIDTGEKTANCGWGGDGSVLYITADMYLARIKTTTRGAGWK